MQKQQLAMAEIPVQEMGELYEPGQALRREPHFLT